MMLMMMMMLLLLLLVDRVVYCAGRLQQQFIDEILNTGLLLYASRSWLSQVFHLIITQDLFTSVIAADTQVLTTLLSGNLLCSSTLSSLSLIS